jgi:replicative DNA helicase
MTQRKQLTLPTDYGRIPPQATDLEEAVIGAVLLDSSKIDEVIDRLKPEAFYKNENRIVWNRIVQLYQQGTNIDTLTVINSLRDKKELNDAGGVMHVSKYSSSVQYNTPLLQHALIIIERYMGRELIRLCSQLESSAYDTSNDIFDVVSKAELSISEITNSVIKKDFAKIARVYSDVIKEMEEKETRKKLGLTLDLVTGFPNIDRASGGLHKSDLIILAARPSMGKTAFALTIARNVAVTFGHSVGVFSLEMSSKQLVTRLMSMETKIESSRLRDSRLSPDDWAKINTANALINSKIFIDDTPSITLIELKAKARRMKAKHGIELLIVDYLQLMTGPGENRTQEVSAISQGLKAVAKELDIPVIALSQLSRALEIRPNKRPILSDLRESGAIEQDADIVWFLYRPEKYGIIEDDAGNDVTQLAEVITAKNRNGETGTEKAYFIKEFTEFVPDPPVVNQIETVYVQPALNPNRQFESDRDEMPF